MKSGTGSDVLDSALARHFPGVSPVQVLMVSADTDGFEAIKILRDPQDRFGCYLTYGISDLAEKRSTHPALSGLGYELTLRVPCSEPTPPDWPIAFLNNLARHLRPKRYDVVDSEPLLFNEPLTQSVATSLTGVMLADDVQFGYGMDTPNGHVQFRQVVGITQDEGMFQAGFGRPALQEKIAAANPFLLSILDRSSVLPPPM